MRIGLAACLGAALLLSAPAVFAAQSGSFRVAAVLVEQAQLRTELEAGSGRAAGISAEKRADLLVRQKELLDMLEGRKSTKELSEAQRSFARDTLALIDAAVIDDDEDRLVCRREKTIGSNMVTRSCRTLSQIRRDQETARDAVRQMSRD